MPIFGGTWDADAPPVRSGLFFNVVQEDAPAAAVPADGVVALIGTAEWGPHNEIVTISSEVSAENRFYTSGTLSNSSGLAFRGSGGFGASQVMVYRIVGGNPATATAALDLALGGTGITLTSLYVGTRANGFTATVRENPTDSSYQDVILYEGTTVLETHTFATTDSLTAVAAQITADSEYVAASTTTTGAIDNATGITFSGGSSGDALASGDYDTAMAAFEAIGGQFGVFCVDDYDGLASGVQTSINAWVDRLNEEGSLFMMVVGGAAGETTSTATTRSATIDSENVVNISRDMTVDGTSYSSSELSPLVAGAIAGVNVSRAISMLEVTGATVDNPPTVTEVEALASGGVVSFVASDAATTRMQRGRTTLTTLTSTKGDVFQSILQVRKIHHTLRQLTDVYLAVVGAGLPNNAVGRGEIMGAFKAKLDELTDQAVVNPDWTIGLDTTADNTGETLHVNLVARPAPTVEVVLGTWVVPTA